MVETAFGTTKPKELDREQREAIAAEEEKKRLESKTAFLSVAESESHKVLVGLINKKLEERITELVDADPEASVCVKILSELGIQKGHAAQAAKKLEELYLKTK